MYYLLITIAAVFFSVQFLFQKCYEEKVGSGHSEALLFSVYKGLTIAVIMLFVGRFKLQFTLYSFIMAGFYALCYILMNVYSLKAFSVANLSVYSVFTMLGGMILPFFVGIIFYGEEFSVFKFLCCFVIVIATLLNINKGKSSKKAFFYYMMVFFLNGMVAALSKIHTDSSLPHTDSTSFVFYSGIFTLVICGVWMMKRGEKFTFLKGKSLAFATGNGILNGVGDLLLLVALLYLPASVQYPIVTGGVMVFSTVISMIRKERIKKKEYAAAIVAFIGSILMAF